MKSFLFTFMLLLSAAGAQNLRSVTPEEENDVVHQRRELFDFWQFLMLIHPPPPPHPKKHGGGSGGSSSNGKYSNGGDYKTGQEASYEDQSESVTQYSGESSASSSNKASPDLNGVYNSGKATAAAWMLWMAVAAAAVAAMAVVFGQRKNRPEAHPLTGSVARRAALFGAFADSALCSEGNSRAVELTASMDNNSKSALV